ncbi:MAG: hypothetical protein R3A79_24365 [Nannocystaceae bacterium]
MVSASTWTKLLALPFAASLLAQSGCVCGPGPNVGGYDEEFKDPPKSLQGVKFEESEKGAPEVIGCADGQREGFADLKKHKRIAGCVATWQGVKSLRDKPTGKACGDDGEICDVPADACSPGWHVCGSNGKNTDLKSHTSWRACDKEAGPGKFIAAMSHGQTDELCPPPPTANTQFPCMESGYCSEPVCCGNDCQMGKCRDAVWRGKTKISLGKQEGCGAVTSERNGGVLCCFDGPGDPKPANPETPEAAPIAGESDGIAAPTGGEAAATDGVAPTGAPAGTNPPGSADAAGGPLGAAPGAAPAGEVDSTKVPAE